MSAVGLSDLYRYGARFVGYVLVVTAAGGALVAGGYVLGASDLSTQAATNEALLGIAAGAIGVLLVLSGLVGLIYKLIADAVMAGTVAARRTAGADADVAAAATDEQGADGADEAEQDDDTDGSVTTGVPADGEPADDAPVDDEPSTGEPESPTESEPAEPTVENPQPTAEAEAATAEPEPTDDADETAVEAADEQPDESVAETPTEQAAETVVEPEIDQPDEPAAEDTQSPAESTGEQSETATADAVNLFEGADDTESADAGERDAEAPPQEWSPPDPSEFERSESVEPATDVDSDESGSDETGSAESDEDAFEDWETGETGATESDADTPRTAADLFGEQGASTDDEFVEGESEQPDKRLIDDDDTEESIDEGTTLADEGVEGFEVESDSDPLSDALDEE